MYNMGIILYIRRLVKLWAGVIGSSLSPPTTRPDVSQVKLFSSLSSLRPIQKEKVSSYFPLRYSSRSCSSAALSNSTKDPIFWLQSSKAFLQRNSH